jgi:hypothetical protein
MTGVIATLGYRNEKNKFVAEPAVAKIIDRIHMRGVLMDSEVLSVAGTEARTSGYGELSGGSSTLGVYSCSTPEALPPVRVLAFDDSALPSAKPGVAAKEVFASKPMPTSLVIEEDRFLSHSVLRKRRRESVKFP